PQSFDRHVWICLTHRLLTFILLPATTCAITHSLHDALPISVTATAERVERRPRLQRDAADSEQPSDDRKPVKRASYNPHFTEDRSEEHTSELQSRFDLVCRLLLEEK